MGQKNGVLVPRRGSAEDILVSTFTFASGPSAEFSMEFSNQRALAHICVPAGRSMGQYATLLL